MLFANNSIMSGRPIWSLRHLEHQNLFIILDSIGRARMVHNSVMDQNRSEEQRSTVVLNYVIFPIIML